MQISLLPDVFQQARGSALQAGRVVERVEDAIGVLLPQVQAEPVDLQGTMRCHVK